MNTIRDFYEKRAPLRERELKRYYHRLLERYYRFFVPEGVRILEAGCGLGDLLKSLNPSVGVGVDISPAMIGLAKKRHPELNFYVLDVCQSIPEGSFDYIIASDLINDLPDVQKFFENLHTVSTSRTRLVLNFFNSLWQPVLAVAEKLGLKSPVPPQNWLSLDDVKNLLYLAGWEVIKTETKILFPVRLPLIEPLFNKYLAPLLKNLCLAIFVVARPRPDFFRRREYSCSVVIPARNEAGNIENAVKALPELGSSTEIIFVEGHSTDNTWAEILRVKEKYPEKKIIALKQTGKGKGNAVREGFNAASGELLFILDADLTVEPAELKKFYEAAARGCGEFINGVRLVYPMESQAMRFLNMVANKFFSMAFTWLLGQPVKDTLCGTKVLFKSDYERIAKTRAYFGDFDPFGDFDLLFGAAKLNLRIVDLPIRYKARIYGETNISRWRHGWLLLKMTLFAATKFKFL